MGRQQNLATCCSARKPFASTQIQVSITLKHILGCEERGYIRRPNLTHLHQIEKLTLIVTTRMAVIQSKYIALMMI
jgi:hypothetical protein